MGITDPVHKCSPAGPVGVRGIELGMEEEARETPVWVPTREWELQRLNMNRGPPLSAAALCVMLLLWLAST